MTVPYWVQDAIFYQIFPDRFADGDPSNNPVNVRAWSAAPTIEGFHGGDLRGIIRNFDYLLDLGVTALYLNPIFLSPSTHRYNTMIITALTLSSGICKTSRPSGVAHTMGCG
jgi:hypothetical protein